MEKALILRAIEKSEITICIDIIWYVILSEKKIRNSHKGHICTSSCWCTKYINWAVKNGKDNAGVVQWLTFYL